jgi:NAD(P)-dependent dehydrogenase (short-subunit alcohol dehydrogenase family)
VIPLARHARPEEIARSALYLASDLSSFVTATTRMVDGGMRDFPARRLLLVYKNVTP